MTIEELIESTRAAIYRQFEAGHACVISYSGGKDSGCLANIVLLAARDAARANLAPIVVVSSGNTLVDNPEITQHVQAELDKMEVFGKASGFDVITQIVAPNLSSCWQVKVLTGRGLPSFIGAGSDCTVDLKINPQKVFRRKLFKDMQATVAEPIICIGTRFEESERRAANMKERGESAEHPVRNKDGELVFSPIANFSTDDVWEAIGTFGAGIIDSYTTFESTRRIYAHAESMSCAVVADSISAGRKKGQCSARTGCFVCLKAEDKSLANMVQFDERYSYAKGLIKLNQFMRNTRFDWERRHWIGRTIKEGYAVFAPDTYHPSMQREMFRYIVQLDHDEAVRAAKANSEPMFQILSKEMIVAIDAIQSLNGYAKPFSAWADYNAITENKVRYDIPDIEPVPETPMPSPRFIFIGNETDEGMDAFSGLRDVYLEGLTEGSPCAPVLRDTVDGRSIWDIDTAQSFNVHTESAHLLHHFELESMLKKYEQGYAPGSVTAGYKYYLQYGALELSHSQVTEHDKILRRTAMKDRLGLSYDYDIQTLREKSVAFDALPDNAKAAWGHKMKDGKVAQSLSIADLQAVVQMSLFDENPDMVFTGTHSGKVIDVTGEFAIQKVGRDGAVVKHAVSMLSGEVVKDQIFDIKYSAGLGSVSIKVQDIGLTR